MLWPHRADDGKTRCPGSGQRVVIDLTFEEWEARLAGIGLKTQSVHAISGGLPGLGKRR
jgi:hypothetical protein